MRGGGDGSQHYGKRDSRANSDKRHLDKLSPHDECPRPADELQRRASDLDAPVWLVRHDYWPNRARVSSIFVGNRTR